MSNKDLSVKKIIAILGTILMLQILLSFFVSAFLTSLGKQFDIAIVTGLVNSIVIGTYLILNQSKKSISSNNFYDFIGFKSILIIPIIVGGLGFHILLSELDNLVKIFLPMPDYLSSSFHSLINSKYGIIASIITLSIVAPLTEELLFRGIVLANTIKYYGEKKGIFISSILFAIFHLNPWQFIPALLLGSIFSILYIRTKSIIPSIVAHSFINFLPILSFKILDLKIPGYTNNYGDSKIQPIWFDLFGTLLILAGGLTFILIEKYKFGNKKSGI